MHMDLKSSHIDLIAQGSECVAQALGSAGFVFDSKRLHYRKATEK